MKILTREEMARLEQSCGVPIPELMERAGFGVAKEIKNVLGALDKKIVFIIGPGNNGGDGLVAAYYLHNWGAKAFVFLTSPRSDAVFERVKKVGSIPISMELEELKSWLSKAEVVVDALFGTGKIKPLSGIYKEALTLVTQEKKRRPVLKIFALDLPSGLDADTGEVDPSTLASDFTLTIGFPKRGLFYFPGASKVGQLKVIDIGFPSPDIPTELLTPEKAGKLLPQRLLNAHKGTFGRVLVVAGSANYIGAAYLAILGAYRIGAGLVTLVSPKSLHPIFASKLTEATHVPVEDEVGFFSSKALPELKAWLPNYDAFIIGCGLGQKEETKEFLLSLLSELKERRVVLDADGLNNLSRVEDWWHKVPEQAILTPHPGEISRLCRASVSEIEKDRIETARRWAGEWGKVLVLKGAFTVIASPDGRVMLSPFANPLLASGGTGDVLSGIIGGLLAQGLSPFDSACLGVYIHGLAAELLKEKFGDSGLVASDLLDAIPQTVKELKKHAFGC